MSLDTIHLKVVSREGIVFDGDVASVTSFNDKGRFDVLPSHANFISLIEKSLVIRGSDKKDEKELTFDVALMRVVDNNIEVYLGVKEINKS
jgi:F0F1-type ATP synthase epsilon subunit